MMDTMSEENYQFINCIKNLPSTYMPYQYAWGTVTDGLQLSVLPETSVWNIDSMNLIISVKNNREDTVWIFVKDAITSIWPSSTYLGISRLGLKLFAYLDENHGVLTKISPGQIINMTVKASPCSILPHGKHTLLVTARPVFQLLIPSTFVNEKCKIDKKHELLSNTFQVSIEPPTTDIYARKASTSMSNLKYNCKFKPKCGQLISRTKSSSYTEKDDEVENTSK